MNKIPTSIIIKEYYDIISPLLAFRTCDEVSEIENRILSLLCTVNNCEDVVDECRAMIDDAECLQTFSDGALLSSSDFTEQNIAFDIKAEVLTSCQISKTKNFEEFTFIKELRSCANIGKINSCRLLAFLNWIGLIVPSDVKTAETIWAALAMAGDWMSIKMLIYAYNESGDAEEAEKWAHIYDILKTEYDAFSVIAVRSDYPQYSEDEVSIADLIMFISQKNAAQGSGIIDRPMIHYVLNSKDDYLTKMRRLSDGTNFYIALHNEDKSSGKKCGF